jgi:oligopeptidase B
VAERRPHDVVSPNGTRDDPYYWLRDDARKDPDVLAYLEAENAYKEAFLAPVAGLEETLFQEIIGRIKQDDSSVPYRDRGYFYYVRWEEGAEYPIHARKKGSLEASEQIMLDEAKLAEPHDFYAIGDYVVSPDGERLAYAEDTVGRRQYTVRFKSLSSGEVFEDQIPNCSGSMAWVDDRNLFYVEKDPVTLLGVRVRRHELGTDSADDPIVYEEADHSFYIGVGRTSDHQYVVIHLGATITDEVRYVPVGDPTAVPTVLAPRERGMEYDADHLGSRWIVRTNWDAENFRLMEVDDAKAGSRERWKELMAHSPDVYISSFTPFRDHLVIGERSEGLQRIRIREWKSGKERFIDADESAYSAYVSVNMETDTEWLRYSYSSLTTPRTIYDLNMKTGERKLLKQDPVLGGFDSANYETERVWATARDGEKVPVSLLYRKGLARDGTAPLYLYGYGSYGSSMDPNFRSWPLSLVDRGFVFGIAHIRGGQEMGRRWYEAGKLLHKKNTFNDFVDVTEHLVNEKWAAPDKVVAAGGSAGGLLMGAIINQRPDLYRVIVASVPFVDVVTTMLDESIPLTTNEFDEWGNPKEKKFYDYMLSYSPYDNVEAKDYPAMIVTTGLWDSQVQYFEPAKWVAKLRATKTDQNPLLLHTNMDAGHGGASGRFRSQRETAMEFAFVLQQLGMTGVEPAK